jgi:hypothetical protein
MGALLSLLKGNQLVSSPEMPEVANEQVSEEALRAARKRRGLNSTILTGDLGVNPLNVGRKRLLGGGQ